MRYFQAVLYDSVFGLVLFNVLINGLNLKNKQTEKVLIKFEYDTKLETKIILYCQSKQDGIYSLS